MSEVDMDEVRALREQAVNDAQMIQLLHRKLEQAMQAVDEATRLVAQANAVIDANDEEEV